MDESIRLYVGRTFPSFKDFTDVLKKRQTVTGEVFSKACGGLTVANANRQIMNEKKHFKKKFEYACVFFRCEREGIYTPKGKKRNRISIKMGCPVKLKLVAKREGDCMEITKCDMNHNHDIIDTATLYKRSTKLPSGKRVKRDSIQTGFEDALLLKELPYVVTVAGMQDIHLLTSQETIKEEVTDPVTTTAINSLVPSSDRGTNQSNNHFPNSLDHENEAVPKLSQNSVNSKESALSDIASSYKRVVNRLCSADKSSEDQHYAFYVASVLAKLPSDAKDWCQLEIQKILSKARSGTWKEETDSSQEVNGVDESDAET